MTKSIVISLCGVLLAATMATGAEPEKKNLCTNPSMEIPPVKEGIAKDWHSSGTTPQVIDELDSTTVHTGKNSLHFKFKDTDKPESAAPFFYTMGFEQLEAGKTYTLTAWAKGKGFKGTIWMQIGQYPAPFPPEAVLGSPEVTLDTTEWKQLKLTFKAREGITELQARLRTLCPNNVWGGDVWFDDVSLVEGDQP